MGIIKSNEPPEWLKELDADKSGDIEYLIIVNRRRPDVDGQEAREVMTAMNNSKSGYLLMTALLDNAFKGNELPFIENVVRTMRSVTINAEQNIIAHTNKMTNEN